MNDYSESIRFFIQELPKPNAIYHDKGGTIFEVYRVKSFRNKFWRDPVLKKLLRCARNSYHVYGPREPFDEYDPKASIYLVRVIYRSDDGTKFVEEWLSSRLVPGIGNPLGAGELNMYFYQEQPMDYWVQKHIECEDAFFWKYVLSSSRMCGIDPYYVVKGNIEQKDDTGLKHTAVCNAIIRAQFLIDNECQLTYRVVTAIIREGLYKKRLSVEVGGEKIMPLYTTANQFLGIVDSCEIILNRSAFAYEFPFYWLNIGQLVSLLECLQERGKLSEEGMGHYLNGGSIPFDFNPSDLGSLLTVAGEIHDSKMTGEELRALVDKHVEEKPILRITDAREWFSSYLRILDVMGIDIFTQNSELKSFLI